MNSEKFHFEKGLNYRIFDISNPTNSAKPILIPFPCLIYCYNGSANIVYNTKAYTLKKDTILCVAPNCTFKGIETSDDMQALVILFNNELIIDSTIGFKVEYLANIFHHPLKSLDNILIKKLFLNLFETLHTYHEMEERYERSSDFVYTIIRGILISLAELSNLGNEKTSFYGNGLSTTDSYFRDFLILLGEHCKVQHNVAFYADKLCITPKYLNEICRKKTKKTAKEVITRAVIAQIKNALMISGTSVQRIAYEFNFCDQSSFGKYFKKSVGMAPMAFRNKHNDIPDNND